MKKTILILTILLTAQIVWAENWSLQADEKWIEITGAEEWWKSQILFRFKIMAKDNRYNETWTYSLDSNAEIKIEFYTGKNSYIPAGKNAPPYCPQLKIEKGERICTHYSKNTDSPPACGYYDEPLGYCCWIRIEKDEFDRTKTGNYNIPFVVITIKEASGNIIIKEQQLNLNLGNLLLINK